MALIGDAPFDTGYILTGHDFWLEGKKAVQMVYDRFAYVFTRLGWDNPVMLVLVVASIQYCTALAKCIGKSWAILKMAKAKEAPKDGAPAPAKD